MLSAPPPLESSVPGRRPLDIDGLPGKVYQRESHSTHHDVTSRIVVAGDVHLGSGQADQRAFDAFLDDLLAHHRSIAELVLLGDLWDMIRRDPFGAAWESAGTIARLRALAECVPVQFVLGNHDVYLDSLDHSRYEIAIHEEYTLEQADTAIRFTHGNGFDRLQSDRLSTYLSGPGDRGDIDPTGGRKDPVVAAGRKYLQRGKRRLRTLVTDGGTVEDVSAPAYPRRERRAHAFLETIPEEKLVFGHTHAPYVHHENLAANPGSWTATAPVHNTYLAIEDGHIELYRYRESGDDERID